jgi:hypothetical protein
VLSTYSVGSLDIKRNNHACLKNPAKHLFRGKFVLSVKEADEPNTIRWKDLNEKFKDRMKQQVLTAICTVVAVITIAFIVKFVNTVNLQGTAITISCFNVAFPEFAKLITRAEAHSSESGIQRSLYFKIALFRWVNTAVVITIITPFSYTLTNGELINQIYALFFTEIVTTTLIQAADPFGHLQRHFLAPRATTQDAMNLSMQGEVYELAERYTNMTKILFLTLWYCTVFPAAFFMCSFALFVNYFMDRISLMRSWKRAPQLGGQIAEFSRNYFFSLSIMAMAIISSYFWAGFPFDDLCTSDSTVNSTYHGSWILPSLSSNNVSEVGKSIVLDEGDVEYQYCLQDFFRFAKDDKAFPFVPSKQPEGKEWMTPEQEIVTSIFGWSSLAVITVMCLSFVRRWYNNIMGLFRGTYEPCGDDMGINFSDVAAITCYIPQIESSVFSYPLLACNLDAIDRKLLGWTDPERPHDFYDITKDAEVLRRGMDMSNKVVFSQVAHWPPNRRSHMRRELSMKFKLLKISSEHLK